MTSKEQPFDGEDLAEIVSVEKSVVKTVFYLLIFGWVVYLVLEATQWTQWEDYAFVYMLTVPIIFLLVATILLANFEETIMDLAPDRLTELSENDDTVTNLAQKGSNRSESEQKIYTVYMTVWVGATVLLMYYLGFYTGAALAVFGHLLVTTRNVKLATGATALCLVLVYTFFDILLRARGWEGAVTSTDVVYDALDLIVSFV